MPVEDVFSITGRGTVATGRIERGVINSNDNVEIIGMQEKSLLQQLQVWKCSVKYLTEVKLVITLVYCYVVLKKLISVEVWLSQNQVQLHHTLKFKAEIYVLKKEEGGRHTPFHQQIPSSVLFAYN
jgi:elongation factor Tu